MDKYERFKQAILYLKGAGLADTKKSIAETMGASASNVTTAINTGDPRVLTTPFLMRFLKAYDGIFNTDWLLYGTGEMLQASPEEETSYKQEAEHLTDERKIFGQLLEAKDELIKTLKQQLETKDEIIEAKNQLIANLRKQIPYGRNNTDGYMGVSED